MREFGRIYSRLLAINLLGGVVGPLALGLTFDSMGTYQLGLGVFVLLMLMGIVLVTRLGKYPKKLGTLIAKFDPVVVNKFRTLC